MKTNVHITAAAQESVRSSIEYVRLALGSKKAAASLKKEFLKFTESVSLFPEMYPLMEDEALRRMGYRRALVKGYVAVYKYEDDEVIVLGFFHQLQDYGRYL